MARKSYDFINAWVDRGYNRQLKTKEWRVLVSILRHYNEKKQKAWQGYKLISQETKLSNGSIKKALNRLIDMGLISIEIGKAHKRKYVWEYNIYRLTDPDELKPYGQNSSVRPYGQN